jgi:hypothetical protein
MQHNGSERSAFAALATIKEFKSRIRQLPYKPRSSRREVTKRCNANFQKEPSTTSFHYSLANFSSAKISFFFDVILSFVTLNNLGTPVSSNGISRSIIFAIPCVVRRISGIPWPEKPAAMNWLGLDGISPT